MNSLKAAAEALKKSPKMVRKKIGRMTGRHEEQLLEEEKDIDTIREHLMQGMTFFVKKLGQVPVKVGKGTGCTEESVKELVNATKKNKAKSSSALQKLSMTITPELLIFKEFETKDMVEEVPIYRVSYCTADRHYPKVFAFIARPGGSKELFCHVFLTHKSSMAEAVSLAISEAFSMAYESWETNVNREKEAIEEDLEENAKYLYEDLGKSAPNMRTTEENIEIFVSSSDEKEGLNRKEKIRQPQQQQQQVEPIQRQIGQDNIMTSSNRQESVEDITFIFNSLRKSSQPREEQASSNDDDDFQRLANTRAGARIISPHVGINSLKDKGVNFSDFLSVTEDELNLSRSIEDLKEFSFD